MVSKLKWLVSILLEKVKLRSANSSISPCNFLCLIIKIWERILKLPKYFIV